MLIRNPYCIHSSPVCPRTKKRVTPSHDLAIDASVRKNPTSFDRRSSEMSGARVYPATTKHLDLVLKPSRSSSSSWHGGSKMAWPLCLRNSENRPVAIVAVQLLHMV